MVKGEGGAPDINATVMLATSKHREREGELENLEPNKLKTFELSHRPHCRPKVSWLNHQFRGNEADCYPMANVNCDVRRSTAAHCS